MVLYRELAVSQQIVETFSVSCVFGGRSFVQSFLKDVIDFDLVRTHSITRIYALDKWGDGWKHVLNQPSRPMSSIFLPNELKESVRKDMAGFFAHQAQYERNGIAWTRGYLFIGPPGTGKTSFIRALAHEFHLNLCLLSLTDARLSDAVLNDILMKLPPKAALVIEDIDSFFVQRRKEDASMRVSFSGLVNALDGAAVADGRVLFLTTNKRGALDDALIRPGRVDRVVDFELARLPEIRAMFEAFYGPLPSLLVDCTFDQRLSPASIQETMLRYPDNPQAAVSALNEANSPSRRRA